MALQNDTGALCNILNDPFFSYSNKISRGYEDKDSKNIFF
jgi:hypothetical protein